MGDHVLVIGGTLMDTIGKPDAGLAPGTSNPGSIRSSRGGTARNVAENLARLGADVLLITAVGNDSIGKKLIAQTAGSGASLDYSLTIDKAATGAYLALLDEDGSLAVALDDCSVMRNITPAYLHRHRRLFRDADMVMMDGSLTPSTMKTIVRLAKKYKVPLCADPSSSRLASKFRPYIRDLHLLVPNEEEQAALLDVDYLDNGPEFNQTLARRLVSMGVEHVVVSLSDFGLDYATDEEVGHIPPSYSRKVDTTGTGDAVTAAIMFGILYKLPTIECMRLGAAAASLTLQTTETVVPDLSLDLLYDHLIV